MAPLNVKMIGFKYDYKFGTEAYLEGLDHCGHFFSLKITCADIECLTRVMGVASVAFDGEPFVISIGPGRNHGVVPTPTEH